MPFSSSKATALRQMPQVPVQMRPIMGAPPMSPSCSGLQHRNRTILTTEEDLRYQGRVISFIERGDGLPYSRETVLVLAPGQEDHVGCWNRHHQRALDLRPVALEDRPREEPAR